MNLKQYLKNVYELERNVYALGLVQGEMRRQYNQQPKLYRIEKERAAEDASILNKCLGITGIIIVGIDAIAFLQMIINGQGNGGGILDLIDDMLNTFFYVLFLTVVFIVGYALIYFNYLPYVRDKRIKKENEAFNNEIRKNNAFAEQQNALILYENDVEKRKLKIQFDSVDKLRRDTHAILNKYYALNIIHPNYRNLIAISSIYGYIDTGMCNQLTGPHGAYETYEYMSRLGQIITKLDEISEKLDKIMQNQQMLYNAITRSNDMAKQMIGELKAIKVANVESASAIKAIETSTYQSVEYSRMTAWNTEYLKWIDILSR